VCLKSFGYMRNALMSIVPPDIGHPKVSVSRNGAGWGERMSMRR